MTNTQTTPITEVTRARRHLMDPQRLLWRDDVEGICPTPKLCWEYGETVRCGPCATKQAAQGGVESNQDLPNLPEVYRLRRTLADTERKLAEARRLLRRCRDETIGPMVGGGDGGTYVVRHLSGDCLNDIHTFLAKMETMLKAAEGGEG